MRQAVLAIEQELFSRDRQADRDVLASFIARHVFAIRRFKIEGSDILAFFDFACDGEVFEEAPAIFLGFRFFVHAIFDADENIGDDAISFCPSVDDVVCRCIAEHFFDRLQKIFTDDWVMLRFDPEAHVFMGNLFNGWKDRFQIIDMDSCCIDCIGKRCLLAPLFLVGLVKDIQEFRMRFEHIAVKNGRDGFSVLS